MNINIFGSTGIIGKKTLKIIEKLPNFKVNLLCAGSNYKLLTNQIKLYKPKYVYLNNLTKIKILKSNINKNTKILNYKELIDYLISTKSDYTILAISGYKSLYFLDAIIKNTNNLGLVSKESIVSAGHIFKKNNYFKKTNIFPLDSEHFSLFEVFKNNNYDSDKIKNVILTASGGPFYKKKYKNLTDISFNEAVKHPKWNMGYKNSIDSATLVNKCLEIIEAHYLFSIPYKQIKILIHPEALVHSIIEYNNFTSSMNLFKNDMSVPILNFLIKKNTKIKYNIDLDIKKYSQFNFEQVNFNVFPIYKYFKSLNKKKPENIIKFNVGNEFAVNLFKNKRIKYTDIYKIIKKVGSLNLYSSLNNIKDITNYHEEIESYLLHNFKINN
ncbi:MAG: hypothetical protein CBD97_02810 [Pelagibacteraceae bacterium TMED237]|nr:MAG: hypothetical protein CBD97_02810 [Pelagibacteraceae bacterium TMED237]